MFVAHSVRVQAKRETDSFNVLHVEHVVCPGMPLYRFTLFMLFLYSSNQDDIYTTVKSLKIGRWTYILLFRKPFILKIVII